MKHKGYKLTNFRCNADNAERVKGVFVMAVDTVDGDTTDTELSLKLITAIFNSVAGHLLNDSPISANEKFEINYVGDKSND